MEHPFISGLNQLSTEELQEKISGLNAKLTFSTRMHNHNLSGQILMALESYKNEYTRRMDELYKKQNIQNNIQISKDNK